MPTIKQGTIKRIHINGALLRKHSSASKPISIRNKGKVRRASDVLIHGASRLVYRPRNPLSSGAVLWIETLAEVDYT